MLKKLYHSICFIMFWFLFIQNAYSLSKIYTNHPLPQPNKEGFDKNGIRLHDYKGLIGYQYNPLFICNDALDYYRDYFSRPGNFLPNSQYKIEFFKIVDWLLINSEKEGLNIRKIPYKFSANNQTTPWYSGITQARAAKVFILAYIWEKNEKYLKIAEELIRCIFIPIQKGGFSYNENNLTFFEEYINPAPNHVLNGHMSIIVDLHEIRNELKKAGKKSKIDDLILFNIVKGINSLKLVLPLYEKIDSLNLGLCMKSGDVFSNPHIIENTHKSYDLIHLKYFNDLFTITKDEFFENHFYKYYAMIGFSSYFKEHMNVLSNKESSIIVDSGFPRDGRHSLISAFRNFDKDPKTYATSSAELKENAYFVVDLGKIREVSKIEVRFHWDEFPRDFSILAEKGKKWIPICKETNWSSGPEYEKKLVFPIKTKRIKFVASNFNNQKRILLDYMYVYERFNKKESNLDFINFIVAGLKKNKKSINLIYENTKKRYNNGEELFDFSFLQADKDLILRYGFN